MNAELNPIERLRKSKADADQATREEATQEGRDWAEQTAEYYELARFVALDVQAEANAAKEFSLAPWIVEHNDMESLRDVLFGEGDKPALNSYVLLFHEGAKEVFDKIDGQI
jgi:hypothetical protein